MTEPAPSVQIGPTSYTSWRATPLGAITEALEQRLLLGLVGDPAGRRILDAGCGDGALACTLAARGAVVTGVDPDPAMLAAARGRADRAGVQPTFVAGRVDRLPFPDASFDVVVAVTVLCFVPDAAGAVREMARVLRPGGRLVIGELGRWSLWALLRRLRGWGGSATWRVAHFRTASELRGLFNSADVPVDAVRGAVYYPPVGAVARPMLRADPWLGRRTTFGAAFLAIAGMKAPT